MYMYILSWKAAMYEVDLYMLRNIGPADSETETEKYFTTEITLLCY